VSDTVTTARRWNSFVCPGCRCVFRVPQDHDGAGVVCPACRIMLRLPGPDDELPPLVAPQAGVAEPVEIEEFEEDTDTAEDVAAARSDRTFIATLAVAGVALVGLVAWWMMPDEKAPAVVVDAPPPPVSTSSTSDPVDAPKPLLLEIEATVKAFLSAPTREEALKWVLDPATTAARWSAWSGDESHVAPGFQGMVGEPVTTGIGEGAVSHVQVRTGDFKLRGIALVKREGKLKVDWDSWAGWSELSWADFKKQKPVEPKLFRVVLSSVEYFNFDFRDDREWSSYRLDSPDGMSSLYGYVKRTGELDQQLRPVDPGAKSRWLLKLKFPPGATQEDQVLIDSIVAEGWVDRTAEE
jgi:hypothetical protein